MQSKFGMGKLDFAEIPIVDDDPQFPSSSSPNLDCTLEKRVNSQWVEQVNVLENLAMKMPSYDDRMGSSTRLYVENLSSRNSSHDLERELSKYGR
uniref:RRM domain-containing protein n=1 Tax=Solanum lycopersicum TaxID=4081 RepID=A0A3Q7IG19_SOLLC